MPIEVFSTSSLITCINIALVGTTTLILRPIFYIRARQTFPGNQRQLPGLLSKAVIGISGYCHLCEIYYEFQAAYLHNKLETARQTQTCPLIQSSTNGDLVPIISQYQQLQGQARYYRTLGNVLQAPNAWHHLSSYKIHKTPRILLNINTISSVIDFPSNYYAQQQVTAIPPITLERYYAGVQNFTQPGISHAHEIDTINAPVTTTVASSVMAAAHLLLITYINNEALWDTVTKLPNGLNEPDIAFQMPIDAPPNALLQITNYIAGTKKIVGPRKKRGR